jgi:ATP-dependent Zn protease
MEHCHRPWWKRPPVWFIVIAAVLLLGVAVMEQTGKRPAMPYGAFLDQVEADNVESVTFHGTEISGHFKHPLDNLPSSGAAQRDSFRSRVPDFGDPTLIPELRKQHVVIDITSPSAWTWLLGRVPWPMLIFVGAILVAGLVRLMRGGKAPSGAVGPVMPMHGMMGLVSGLFAKKDQTAPPPPTHNSDEPKSR